MIARLEELARGPLRGAFLEALTDASGAGDDARLDDLLRVAGAPLVDLPGELACLRTAGGGLACLDALQPRRFSLNKPPLYYAAGASRVVDALTERGEVVLLGPPEARPGIALAVARTRRQPADAEQAFYWRWRRAPTPRRSPPGWGRPWPRAGVDQSQSPAVLHASTCPAPSSSSP